MSVPSVRSSPLPVTSGSSPQPNAKTSTTSSTSVSADPLSGVSVSRQDTFTADSGLSASGSTNLGGVQVSGNVSGPQLTIDGHASSHVGLSGVDVNVNVAVDADLAKAGAEATKTFTVDVAGQKLDITVDLTANGMVGADGHLDLNVHIGTDGSLDISAGADGFVGAKASLGGSITVSADGKQLATGTADLSAYAGAGASASAHVTVDHGDVDFEARAMASAGAGYGFDLKGHVNSANTALELVKIFDGLAGQGVGWAQHAVTDAGSFLGQKASDVGSWIDQHVPHPHLPW